VLGRHTTEIVIKPFNTVIFNKYISDVQKFVRLTRSKSSGNMTEETGRKLEQVSVKNLPEVHIFKLLKYDMDIYNLAKQVFHNRLKENGIESDSF
jgi:hypothetical protein